MKILVVIANYGLEQIQYLKQIVQEFQSYPCDVDIIINTNVATGVENVKDNIFELENKMEYPLSTWKTILENKGKYDLYIMDENDILITWDNIKFWLESTQYLPVDIITGFLRYEIDEKSSLEYPYNREYCDIHRKQNPYYWDVKSTFILNGITYSALSNLHQGCFILNNNHLNYVCEKINLNDLTTRLTHNYGIQERANSEIFNCFRKKIIPISEQHFEKILIHHLPNRFAKYDSEYWQRGINYETMSEIQNYLMLISKHWELNNDFIQKHPSVKFPNPFCI
jgi:hypothetical protein